MCVFEINKNLESVKEFNNSIPLHAQKSSFINLNILERNHIQEWIHQNPQILGEDLLILSIEFDRFTNSRKRLDVLALDKSGNIVVIELKRDTCAGYADLQAITYAAMISTMTLNLMIPYFIKYRKEYFNETISDLEAKERIFNFVSSDFFEFSNTPRIILCSENFSNEILTTVFWLNDTSNINIKCITLTPYTSNNNIFVESNNIKISDYTINIRKKDEIVKEAKRKARQRTMTLLLENNVVNIGDKVYLNSKLPNNMIFNKNDNTFCGEISEKGVLWYKDDKNYAISAITDKIFQDYYPNKKVPTLSGANHWTIESGKTLSELAHEFLLTQ